LSGDVEHRLRLDNETTKSSLMALGMWGMANKADKIVDAFAAAASAPPRNWDDFHKVVGKALPKIDSPFAILLRDKCCLPDDECF